VEELKGMVAALMLFCLWFGRRDGDNSALVG
jgi:hypothetical protein